ncbi:hypothetical protein CS369_08185 [Candidatus Symbiopectobacterium sp. 'North America']|nr:hypothetical protein [Candidatus Symbiopectobacterium sp. 'North America']
MSIKSLLKREFNHFLMFGLINYKVEMKGKILKISNNYVQPGSCCKNKIILLQRHFMWLQNINE